MIGLVQFEFRHWDLGSVIEFGLGTESQRKRDMSYLLSFVAVGFLLLLLFRLPRVSFLFCLLHYFPQALLLWISISQPLQSLSPSLFLFLFSSNSMLYLIGQQNGPGAFPQFSGREKVGNSTEAFSARVNPCIRRIIMQRSGNSHYLEVTITQITQYSKTHKG